MEKTLKELANYVGGKVVGDENLLIKGVMTIDDAIEGYITFISNKRYVNKLEATNASAVIVSPSIHSSQKPLLVIDNPYLAFAKIVDFMMYKKPVYSGTIDPTAEIGKNVQLGDGVTIYKNVTIRDNAVIKDNVVLYPGVYIGEDSVIGSFAVLHPNAVVYNGTIIGERVIIHSNAVIGSSGFGYAPDEGKYYNIPQVGIVIIEDDVVIEPCTTISRAALGVTRVRRGAKVGSNVVIAHNCDVGENTLIVSQSGLAGSATVGRNVIIGGQVGIAGHLTIGDNSQIGGCSGVANSLPANGKYLGTPAIPINKMRKCYAVINHLPEMRQTVKDLKKRIEELEEKLNDK